MIQQFHPGDRVRRPTPGGEEGVVVSVERDRSQVPWSRVTYTVEWDNGTREEMVYPGEIEAVDKGPRGK
jgi:hypothetical protein